MAVTDITLTSGMRSNLLSLQGTVELLNRTQERLASGKKVNSPLDNATNYFVAKSHLDRAGDLAVRKDGMGEAIQTVKAANAGIEAIQQLIESAKGIAQSAYSSGASGRETLAAQFDEMMTQIDNIAADAGYKGANLLDGDDLTVVFNEDGSSDLTISGFSADSSGLAIAAAQADWVADTDIDPALEELDAALEVLRSNSQVLSANLNIVTTRNEFTEGMTNILSEGADKLTAADTNEEGANMLMLQVRQALGTTALSLSAQAAQSVLRLF
ncbi:MAG: flagellin [Deltaproteobacteria bacterium]|nr:flagellin [Deltaproteobacteria bacterium]